MDNKKDYSDYVALYPNANVIQSYTDLVGRIVKSDDLYYSDVVPRIAGDMLSKLHLTLYFGLDSAVFQDMNFIRLLKSVEIKDLKLGNLFLMPGYQGLYKILCIEVLDEDGRLKELSSNIGEFNIDGRSYEFKPHLTLAYVQPQFEIAEEYKDMTFPNLAVESIKHSGK